MASRVIAPLAVNPATEDLTDVRRSIEFLSYYQRDRVIDATSSRQVQLIRRLDNAVYATCYLTLRYGLRLVPEKS